MRRIAAIIAILITSIISMAQDKAIVVRRFSLDPFEMRAKTDPVYDRSGNPSAMIVVRFAAADSVSFNGNIVGSPLQSEGESIVYMPAGSKWIEISAKGCGIKHFDFPEDVALLPMRGYLLNLAVVEANPLRTLIIPVVDFNLSQTSFGLMIGLCRKRGGYVKALTDFNFGLRPETSTEDGSTVSGGKAWFTGSSARSRYSFTAGYLRRIAQPVYLYAGGGYGGRILAWEYFAGEGKYAFARVNPCSVTGFEAEAGAVVRLRGLALSAGVQTIRFKYCEASLGVGLFF